MFQISPNVNYVIIYLIFINHSHFVLLHYEIA